MRRLVVSGSWFMTLSLGVLTFNAVKLLLHAPAAFSWFEIAVLCLIAAVTVKMYIDAWKQESEEPE